MKKKVVKEDVKNGEVEFLYSPNGSIVPVFSREKIFQFHALVKDIWNLFIRWGYSEGDWVDALKIYQTLQVFGYSHIYILIMFSKLKELGLILFKKEVNSENYIQIDGVLYSHILVWEE